MTQFGYMLCEVVGNEVLLGTIRGFSYIYDAATSISTQNNDYTNPFSQ